MGDQHLADPAFLGTPQALPRRPPGHPRGDRGTYRPAGGPGRRAGQGRCRLLLSHQDVFGLQQITFAQDRIVLVAPPEHGLVHRETLGFADIARHELVGWDEGVALGALLQSLAAAANATLRIRLQVRSLGALCSMVKAGLGIGVAPYPRVLGEATDFGLATVPISESWAMRQIQLVHRGDDVLGPAARLFVTSMAAP
ncbi:MAG: LysR substrate-binding domain-containing protein [Pseudorhodoferax sp.]